MQAFLIRHEITPLKVGMNTVPPTVDAEIHDQTTDLIQVNKVHATRQENWTNHGRAGNSLWV